MKITYLSDCHGKWAQLNVLIQRHCPHNPIVQLGDLGIFSKKDSEKRFPDNFYFIHGNHSNFSLCKTMPNFLGRFGFNKDLNLFFISGAYSIDQNMRMEGVSWWRDEELDWAECQECLELYNKIKPRYVISHDFPECISQMILKDMIIGGERQIKTRTGQLLNQLFQDHKPELWLGAHYHLPFDKEIMGTRFICMPELGTITLDIKPLTK